MEELDKPCAEAYYFPTHAVWKETSSTSKIRCVFDASATTTSGISLIDQLLVGPTVHSSLIDVLLQFRQHRVALTADVSRMYCAVLLPKEHRDLHRFLWRKITRLKFGVSASSFAVNMALKSHPQAYQAVIKDLYVDNGLTSADSEDEAIRLREQLQDLFNLGGFKLRK